jgi:hypothetical protein
MRTMTLVFAAGFSAVAVLIFPPIGNAEQWNKETVVNLETQSRWPAKCWRLVVTFLS